MLKCTCFLPEFNLEWYAGCHQNILKCFQFLYIIIGSYPKAQGFGGAQQTGFGTPQPLFGTGSKNSGSRPLLDTPTGFGTQSGFGNPQPLFGTGSGFGEKSKPNDSAKPKPLFGIETGFGVKPKQIGFGTETGFGVKPKQIGFGTPQPLFGTGTGFGVQQKQIGFGTPQPLFGINTGFGTGFSAIEVEQWQKYDGKKRTLTGLAIGGSRSVAKKAKRNNESKIKLVKIEMNNFVAVHFEWGVFFNNNLER